MGINHFTTCRLRNKYLLPCDPSVFKPTSFEYHNIDVCQKITYTIHNSIYEQPALLDVFTTVRHLFQRRRRKWLPEWLQHAVCQRR